MYVIGHAFSTNGPEFEMPIELISQILGHSDLKTTKIYAKASDKLKIKQMQKMKNFECLLLQININKRNFLNVLINAFSTFIQCFSKFLCKAG